MKKIYIYGLLVSAIFAFSACEGTLDTEPEGDTITSDQKEEVYENDPEKTEAAVNTIFAEFSQYMPNYDDVGSNHDDFGYPSIMMYMDANGYDFVSADVGYNWAGNSLDYTDRIYTSDQCQIVWNDLYSMIYNCNSIIGSISSDTEDVDSQYYLAQGLAVRGFCYWVLAQLYQFNYVGHESSACVPIITNENSEDAAVNGAARNTVQEVYDQVLEDLNSSVTLLTSAENAGVTRDDKRYINLAVAYGLRARVNLTMENWSDAASDASSAISNSSASPATMDDVSSPYFVSVDEGNWMWGIIISETDEIVSSAIVNRASHLGSLNYGYANYNNGRQLGYTLYHSIPETDVRKGWWLDEDAVSSNLSTEQQAYMEEIGYDAYTQVKFAPYNYVVGTSTNANDIPLMRIEEMYLIKAEALAMAGGDGASTLESFIKTYRDADYTCDVTSAEDVQDEVYYHRRIELWGEGMNWFDIMRLGKDMDRRGAGFPNATMVFNIEAESDILLWRIPSAEIEANALIGESDNNPSASTPTAVADYDYE
jgi:hypothetical protein